MKQGFIGWGKDLAYRYKSEFMHKPYTAWTLDDLHKQSKQSLHEQQQLEAKDTLDFDTFLANYARRIIAP